jgi:hypothetical protein
MIWVLIAVFGFAAWLSIVLFFLALCHAAGRADELARTASLDDRAVTPLSVAATGAAVTDLRVFRQLREKRNRAGGAAPRASAAG